MARAHVYRPITSTGGALLYGAQVTVRESGQSALLAQPMYGSPGGTDVLPNPFTADRGVIDFWMDTPQRTNVLVQAPGYADSLVYLDGPPPPEETAQTDSPLRIVGSAVSGKVLLASTLDGQAVWGDPPNDTGISIMTTLQYENFASGADPVSWSMVQQPNTARNYSIDAPAGQADLSRSLHVVHNGNAGQLTATLPGFTLAETGYLGVWFKLAQAAGESATVSVTRADSSVLVLDTLAGTRDWGYYRFQLAAGTYLAATVGFTGASVFVAGAAHDTWMTGLRIAYGGQVPAHTHAGSGSNSVAVGAGSLSAGAGAIAVGVNATAPGSQAIAVGYTAAAAGAGAVAAGQSALAPGDGSVAVGAGAQGNASATNWIAVGSGAYADSAGAVAVGYNAKVYAAGAIALGSTAYVGSSGSAAVAIGSGAQALAPNSVAIGRNTLVPLAHTGSMALGDGAQTSAALQIMLGSSAVYRQVVVSGRLSAVGSVNLGSDGASRLGFFGVEGTTRPTVTGSTGGSAPLQNVLTALSAMGLIVNSTT